MSHRDPHVVLPVSQARCQPSKQCDRKHTCARYLAPLTQGAPLADHSLPVGSQNPWYVWGFHLCTEYLTVSAAAKLEPKPKQAPKPPVKGIA